jgi:cellulose synthase/poly-beta-1,6-N-acetylglucosamine synthase-like glycosyltransferase
MAMVILLLKIYIFIVAAVMIVYAIRSFLFSINRAYGEQALYYQDILEASMPTITVSTIIPMHNEDKVVRHSMDAMLDLDYPRDKLEIIPINDHSEDNTGAILDEYALKYPDLIHPFNRTEGSRGKPAALNDTLERAKGDILILFDADYIPPRNLVRDLAVCFRDPEVGAVMGRVIPMNTKNSTLARLLDLERTGGYQVDQQARFNMRLINQYGGTVGGFRKELCRNMGSFDITNLAEDTELTFKLYINGWKVLYANRLECYEEAPETWQVRARQVNRWARGHTRCLIKYLFPLLRSKFLSPREKLDGVLLLGIYIIPLVLLLGLIDSLILFYLGEMNILSGSLIMLILAVYNLFGNSGPFFQIAIGVLLDGGKQRLRLIPMVMVGFIVYLFSTSRGGFDAIMDSIFRRVPVWVKTTRFRKAAKNA